MLEHVVDPCLAARTLADLCEPGGHVIIGVPFLIKIHPAPSDYWRFTPDGLRLLVEQAGLEPTRGARVGQSALRERQLLRLGEASLVGIIDR